MTRQDLGRLRRALMSGAYAERQMMKSGNFLANGQAKCKRSRCATELPSGDLKDAPAMPQAAA